jgi:hypothetical protein
MRLAAVRMDAIPVLDGLQKTNCNFAKKPDQKMAGGRGISEIFLGRRLVGLSDKVGKVAFKRA